MILPIHIYGTKVLNEPGATIDKYYPDLSKLIEDMFETMYASSGIGLAAHQVGVPINLFIIDITNYKEGDEKLKDFKKVFINSEIIEFSGEDHSVEEGCLSFPGIHFDIKRKTVIKLKYLDENFVEHEEIFDGLASRCIQHEYDHTQGILFTHRTSPFNRSVVKSKLENVVKGKFLTNYKYKLQRT